MPIPPLIRHLVPEAYFRGLPESEPYLPAEFGADGFIHCTAEPEILLRVANATYRQQPGEFLVLLIDPARVRAEVRLEAPDPSRAPLDGETLFPHLYGPLNRDAIVAVRRARRAADGTFLDV